MTRLSEESLVELGEDGMLELIIELYDNTEKLEAKIESLSNGKGRKAEVLDILKNEEAVTIVGIAERLGISAKNVSSQLTYLRQEGHNICTDMNGKKFLVSK